MSKKKLNTSTNNEATLAAIYDSLKDAYSRLARYYVVAQARDAYSAILKAGNGDNNLFSKEAELNTGIQAQTIDNWLKLWDSIPKMRERTAELLETPLANGVSLLPRLEALQAKSDEGAAGVNDILLLAKQPGTTLMQIREELEVEEYAANIKSPTKPGKPKGGHKKAKKVAPKAKPITFKAMHWEVKPSSSPITKSVKVGDLTLTVSVHQLANGKLSINILPPVSAAEKMVEKMVEIAKASGSTKAAA